MQELYVVSIYIVLFVLGLFTGRFSSKDIVFGVTLPEKDGQSDYVIELKKHFLKWYSLIMGLGTVLAITFSIVMKFKPIILNVYTGVWLIITFSLYVYEHKKVKSYKKTLLLNIKAKKQVVSASLENRKVEMKSLYLYFLPSLLTLIMSFVYTWTQFDKLPNQIPLNYDLSGQVTRYGDKTQLSVHGLHLTGVLLLILLYGLCVLTLRYSTRQIDQDNQKTSSYRIKTANKYFGMVMGFIACILIGVFTLIQLTIIGTLEMTETLTFSISLFPILGITIILIWFFLRVGIQGDRLKVDFEEEVREEVGEVDKDKGWYLGMIYCNPKDSHLFIPRRFGGGYTLNFGRPLSWLFIIGLLVILILTKVAL